ncbi:MAG: VPLPA-CTERM sorting domain-containing protein [Pseudomonadota bacterium]
MRVQLIAVLLALLVAPGAAQTATIQTFSDAEALQNSLSSYSVEAFSSQVGKGKESKSNPHAVPEVFDYGAFSITKTYSRNGYGSDTGSWRGKPTSISGDILNFGTAITAWGAHILTGDGGGGVGIRVFADGVFMGAVGTGSDPNDAYFGFLSDTPFSSITLVSGFKPNGKGGSDGYRLDTMTYGDIAVMPLPAGAWLLISGLFGLALARCRF